MAPAAAPVSRDDTVNQAVGLHLTTRNRRRTEKAQQNDANRDYSESDEPKMPATPKKPGVKGKAHKSKEDNPVLVAKLIDLVKSMKEDAETRAERAEERAERADERAERAEERATTTESKMEQILQRVIKLEELVTTLSTPMSPPTSYADALRSASAPPSREPSSQASPVNTASVNPSSSASRQRPTASIVVDLSKLNDQTFNVEDAGAVRHRIKTALASNKNTEHIPNCRLSKDAVNPKKYKLLFPTKESEKCARKHNAWLTAAFEGASMGGDQWFPVKVDSVRKSEVYTEGKITKKTIEALGEENGMEIKHIRWISRMDSIKEHGSMIVYLAREEDAQRLLAEGFMDIYNLAAYTKEYIPKSGPNRCFKCQKFGHRAPRCSAIAPTCSICAEKGHAYHSCTSSIPKCANCGDSHGANDPNCPELQRMKSALINHHD